MASKLPLLPSASDLLQIFRIKSLKRLSQNFLLRRDAVKRVVNTMGSIQGGCVCEVGPGPGSLTGEVLRRGVSHLSVIEVDKRFDSSLELLQNAARSVNTVMTIHRSDILKFKKMDSLFPKSFATDWHAEDGKCNVHILGNLPFKVSTPLMILWLEQISTREGIWKYGRAPMTLTFQKEVAERLVAQPGDPQRCRLSVVAQAYCNVMLTSILSGSLFTPPPKVDVGVVRLTPRIFTLFDDVSSAAVSSGVSTMKNGANLVPFGMFTKLVGLVFSFKKKHIVKGVARLLPADRTDLVVELFRRSGVSPFVRPVDLTLADFRALAFAYAALCQADPALLDYDVAETERSSSSRNTHRRLINRYVSGGEKLTADGIAKRIDKSIREYRQINASPSTDLMEFEDVQEREEDKERAEKLTEILDNAGFTVPHDAPKAT